MVEQRGVDVVLALFDARGRHLTTVDSPNGTWGPEGLVVLADEGAPLRLEVRATEGPPGRYVLEVLERRPATPRDRRRVAAERTFAAGEELRRQGTAASHRGAREAYGEALEAFRGLGDRHRQADVLERLSKVHDALGDAAAGIAVLEEAEGLYRALGDERMLGVVLGSLGAAWRSHGDSAKAKALYGEALELQRRLGDRRSEAVTLVNLGRAATSLGQVDDAFVHYRRALELYRQLGDQTGFGMTLRLTSHLDFELGRPERALETLGDALAALEASGDRAQTASALMELGKTEVRLGRPEDGIVHLRQALPRVRELGYRGWETVLLVDLGWAALELADPEAALEPLGQALDLARDRGDRRHEAAALVHLGRAESELGRADAAVDAFARALELFREVRDPYGRITAQAGLARVERRRGDPLAALAVLERAVGDVEALRLEPKSPALRSAFFAGKRRVYGDQVDLLMELGRVEEAFDASERARARVLLDLLAESAGELRRRIDPGLLAREAELGRRLAAASRRRLDEEAAEAEVRSLIERTEALQAEIRRASPEYAALTRGTPLPLAAVQRRLDGDTLLLEIALGEERSFLWAVTRDTLDSFVLPPAAELEDLARRVHTLQAASYRRLARTPAELARRRLGDVLLGPIAERLAGDRRRLLVVPDGALHYVPFSALPVGGPAAGAPLVALAEVVYLPSASLLAAPRRPEREPKRGPGGATLAVLADPLFADVDRKRFPPLPYSRVEAEAILEMVPADERLAALGPAASRDLALSGQLGPYRFLHFATHGVLDTGHPELSAIVLSTADGQGHSRDGLLQAHDVYRLELDAELVVLSACRTALGREVRGEGLVGLTHGFMAAGARRVLVSLWQVEDTATAELMRLFYREMLEGGRSPEAALGRAQEDLRRQPGREAPYFWAAFVLYGLP